MHSVSSQQMWLKGDDLCSDDPCIGGFRDTYLGRQVVSRPRGPRAGMGSAGDLGEHCELP